MQVLGDGQVRSEMNITPFIDVLLVLLVIFMLMTDMRVIMAQLARQDSGGSRSKSIVLELTNDGRYLLNTVAVPAPALDSTLRATFSVRPDKILLLKAGGQRFYREIIEATDVARGAGVEVIGWAP